MGCLTGFAESAIAYTFLRPNLFMQGLLAFRETIIDQGRFFAAVADARISMVDVRDIASAALAALVEKGHEAQIYNLTGPQALSPARWPKDFPKFSAAALILLKFRPNRCGRRSSRSGSRSGRLTV